MDWDFYYPNKLPQKDYSGYIQWHKVISPMSLNYKFKLSFLCHKSSIYVVESVVQSYNFKLYDMAPPP